MSRTEALQRALSAVWSGADTTDAEAVLDHIHDAGFDVVWRPGLQVALCPTAPPHAAHLPSDQSRTPQAKDNPNPARSKP